MLKNTSMKGFALEKGIAEIDKKFNYLKDTINKYDDCVIKHNPLRHATAIAALAGLTMFCAPAQADSTDDFVSKYNTSGDRSYNFNSVQEVILLKTNLGGTNMADGTLTINGVSDGDNISTIDANGNFVFYLSYGDTLNLNNVKIQNAYRNGGGGAIYNDRGSMGEIVNSSFINNYATGSGGAIYRERGTMGEIVNSSFINNYSSYSGGAIYTYGEMAIVDSSFTNNYSKYDGGAIYSSGGNLTIAAENKDVLFSGNKQNVTFDSDGNYVEGTGTSNAISVSGTLYLNAAEGRTITFDDQISGSGSTLYINDSSNGYNTDGTIVLNNTINGKDAYLYDGTLKLGANGAIGSLRVQGDSTFDISNNKVNSIDTYLNGNTLNLKLDVNGSSVDTLNLSGANGTVNITGIKFTDTPSNDEIIRVLQNATSDTSLILSPELSNIDGDFTRVYNNELKSSDVKWSDKLLFGTEKFHAAGNIETASYNNDGITDALKFTNITKTILENDVHEAEGDIFGAVLNFEGERSFSATSADEVLTLNQDYGNTNMANGTLTIRGVKDGDNISTINANHHSAFSVGSNSTLNLNSVKIQNAYKSDSGSAIYNKGTISAITGSNISDNSATSSGGAIYNANATISVITDSSFSGNSTTSSGGAIYNGGSNARISTITDTTFSENNARYGGAIDNYSGSTINSITDTTFSANNASYGGAIYNYGTINSIIRSTFSGNSATNPGGAIYNYSSTIGAIIDSSFINNYSGSSGGAIYSKGNLTIAAENKDVLFSGNRQNVTFDSDGNYVEGTGSSNAIYMNSGNLYLNAAEGRTITFDDTIAGNTDINNSSTGYGTQGTVVFNNSGSGPNLYGGTLKLGQNGAIGSLNVYGNSTFDTGNNYINTTVNTWLNGNTLNLKLDIKGSKADTLGLYGTGGTVNVIGLNFMDVPSDGAVIQILKNATSASSLTLEGDLRTIDKDVVVNVLDKLASSEAKWSDKLLSGTEKYHATGNIETASYSNNGITDSLKFSDMTKILLESNIQEVDGDVFGAVLNFEGDRSFSATSADEVLTLNQDYAGVDFGNGTLTVNGIADGDNISTIDANGHSVFSLSSGDNLNLNSVKIQNAYKNGYGSAIYNDYGTVNITGSTFTGNRSKSNGGAVYNSGTTNITGSTFTGNRSESNGGAIYNNGTTNITGSTFTGNSTTNYGGAIYNNYGTMKIVDSSFINNYSRYDGGAIYSKGNLTIAAENKDVLFSGNKQGVTFDSDGNYVEGTGSFSAIYSNGSNLYLNTAEGRTITFDDRIQNTSLYINDSSTGYGTQGTVVLNDTINGKYAYLYGGTLKLGANGSIGYLYVQGTSTFDIANDYINNNVYTYLNDNTLNLKLDVNGSCADTLSLSNANGTVNITDINFMSTPSGGTLVRVLYNATSATSLTLGSDISAPERYVYEDSVGLTSNDVKWSDKLTSTRSEYKITNDIEVASYSNNGIMDALKIGNDVKTLLSSNTTEVDGDVFGAVLGYSGERSFSATSANETLTLNQYYGNSNIASGTLTINGVVDGDNISTIDANGHSVFYINNYNGRTYKLNLNNVKIQNAYNNSEGSAIYINSGIVNITGSTFTGNRSKSNGGAIYNSGTMTIVDSSFINNYSSGSGGAIYNNYGNLTIAAENKDVLFSGNKQGVTFDSDGNYVEGTGSSNAIYMNSGNLYLNAAEGRTITFDDQIYGTYLYINDSSTGYGTQGTVIFNNNANSTSYLYGGTLKLGANGAIGYLRVQGASTFDVANDYINSNVYTYLNGNTLNLKLDVNGSSADTLYLNGANGTVNITDINFMSTPSVGTLIRVLQNATSATSLTLGSGISTLERYEYEDSTANLASNDVKWSDKFTSTHSEYKITNDIEVASYSNNGITDALKIGDDVKTLINTETVEVDGDVFYAILHKSGERSFSATSADETLTLNQDYGNSYIAPGTLTINGIVDGDDISTIDANGHSVFKVVYAGASTTLNLNNVKIQNAYKSINGGAIYNESTTNITGSTFTGNRSTGSGGAVYNAGGTVNITDSTFTNNSTTNYGGAIYSTNNLTIAAENKDVLFSGNKQGVSFDSNGNYVEGTGSSNAVYMNGGNLYLNAAEGRTITFDDEIYSGNALYVNNSSTGYGTQGTVVLNNSSGRSAYLYGGTLKLGANNNNSFAYVGYNSGIQVQGEATLDIANNSVNSNVYTSLNNNTLNLKLDVNGSSADTILLGNANGTVNITDINFMSTPSSGTLIRVLTNATSATSLTLAQDVSTIDKDVWVTVNAELASNDIHWSDKLISGQAKYNISGGVDVASYSNNGINDALRFNNISKTFVEYVDAVEVDGDVFYAILHKSGTRSFSATSADETLTLNQDYGNSSMASGALTINGVVDGDDISTIDANHHSVFSVGGNSTLNLHNVKIQNAYKQNSGAVAYNTGTIHELLGEFINNASNWYGGTVAVESSGVIDEIKADFLSNSALWGGAIYNSATITKITDSTFEGNKAKGSSNGQGNGGAIANNGGIIGAIVDSSFINNYAKNYGGAIYSTSSLTIAAENKDVLFSGNKQGVSFDSNGNYVEGTGTSNAIYGGSLYLNAAEERTITFDDKIYGGNNLYVNNSSTGYGTDGTVVLNNQFETYNGSCVSLYDGTLKLGANGSIYNLSVQGTSTFDIANNSIKSHNTSLNGNTLNLKLDVNGSSADTLYLFDANGTVNITDINFMSAPSAGTLIRVLTNATSGTTLSIAENVVDEYSAYTNTYKLVIDGEASNNALWSEVLDSHEEEYLVQSSFKTASYNNNNIMDSIVYEVVNETSTGNTRNYGTVKAFDTVVGAEGTRTLSASTADETYTLTADLPEVGAGSLTLNGIMSGEDISTINANGHAGFNINSGTTFSMNDVKIKNANRAISNKGIVSEITGFFEENNVNSYYNGGAAIYNEGQINLLKADFINNSSQKGSDSSGYLSGGYGGAIYNKGTISLITDSTFTGNSATSDGGAIYNSGTISEITSSNFTNNSAGERGGAIYNSGTTNITGSTFTGDRAQYGGAIYNSGTTNITGSTFTGNSANNIGGAIYNSGTMAIVDSSFINNYSRYNGGAIFSTTSLKIAAENDDVLFSGNKQGVTFDSDGNYVEGTGSSNAIYTSGNYLYLNASEGRTITFDDGIYGNLDINNSSIGYGTEGTVVLNNTINGYTAYLYGGTLKLGANGAIGALQVQGTSTFDIANNYINNGVSTYLNGNTLNLKLDVNGSSADTLYLFDANGTVNITDINFMSAPSGGTLVRVLSNATSATSLTLAQDVSTIDKDVWVTVNAELASNDIHWSDKLISGQAKYNLSGNIEVASYSNNGINDALRFNNISKTFVEYVDTVEVDGDVFGAVLGYSGERSFSATSADETLTLNQDYAGVDFADGTLTVNGVINGDNISTIDANHHSLFQLYSGDTLNLNNVKIQNAYYGGNNGGAIRNNGTTNITNSIFTGNRATSGGGALYNDHMGGTVNITGSTFTGNSANAGGAIYNSGTMTIVDSSFINNYARGDGGAIYSNRDLTIAAENKDVLFSGNKQGVTFDSDGNYIQGTGSSNAIYTNSKNLYLNAAEGRTITFDDRIQNTYLHINNSSTGYGTQGTVVLNDTINGKNAFIYGGTLKLGTNGSIGCLMVSSTSTFDVANDSIGSYNTSLNGNTLNLKLDVNGSSADILSLGNANGTVNITDINFMSTPSGGTLIRVLTNATSATSLTLGSGISAPERYVYEDSVGLTSNDVKWSDKLTSTRSEYKITSNIEVASYSNNGITDALRIVDGTKTLISSNTTEVDGDVFGAVLNKQGDRSFSATSADETLTLNQNYAGVDFGNGTLTVNGVINGDNISTIDANHHSLFQLYSGDTLNLNNVKIQNAYKSGDGGAIYNNQGTTNITGSTFTGNSASYGGAIYNSGTTNITGSTFTGNRSTSNGGAIYNNAGTMKIVDSSFINNYASGNGGAIFSTTSLTIAAENKDVLFSGNKRGVSFDSDGNYVEGTGSSNAIYIINSWNSLKLNAAEGRTITFDDRIMSEGSPTMLQINDSSTGYGTDGTVILNEISGVYYAYLYGGTLKLGENNNNFHDYTSSYISLCGEATLDVANGKFVTTPWNPNELSSYRVAMNGNTLHALIDVYVNDDNIVLSDQFLNNSYGSSGVFDITGVNFVGGNTNIGDDTLIKVLRDNSMRYVTLSVAEGVGRTTEEVWKTQTGVLASPHIKWTDSLNEYREKYEVTKELTVADSGQGFNDSLKFTTVSAEATGEVTDAYLANDTLVAINRLNSNRSFTSNYAGEVYTMTDDMDETAGGTFTINGRIDGDSVSTIDADGHKMFDMQNGGTLILNNVKIENALSDSNGGVLHVGEDATTSINNVTFSNNTTTGKLGGGALYNEGVVGSILADFYGNQTLKPQSSSNNSYAGDGAAILNVGAIDMIKGDFVKNVSGHQAGAIFNDKDGVISEIIGSFQSNSATESYGGAIVNLGAIDMIKADFKQNIAQKGGAVYNSGIINEIVGEFIGNRAEGGSSGNIYGGDGGAVVNTSYGVITAIHADFKQNYGGRGGAIYNEGTIAEIVGLFHGNISDLGSNPSSSYGGGAIFNSGTINTIRADFIENVSSVGGGAIANNGTIDEIVGLFQANHSNNDSNNAYNAMGGGAILNTGTINSIKADFIKNTSKSFGGAISNNGVMTIVDSNFIDNSAAYKGGAIYNQAIEKDSIVNIVAQNADVTFSGNTANGESNAVYNTAIGKVILSVPDKYNMAAEQVPEHKNNILEFVTAVGEMADAYKSGNMELAEEKYQTVRKAGQKLNSFSTSPFNNVSSQYQNVGESAVSSAVSEMTQALNQMNGAYNTLPGGYNLMNSSYGTLAACVEKWGESFIQQLRDDMIENAKNTLEQYYEQYLAAKDNTENLMAAVTYEFPETHSEYKGVAQLNFNAAEDYTITVNDGIDGGSGEERFSNMSNTHDFGKGVININKPSYTIKKRVQNGYEPWGSPKYEDVDEEIALPVSGGTVKFNAPVRNNDLNVYNGTLHLGNRDNVIDGLDLTMYGGTLNTINNSVGDVSLNTITLNNDINMAVDVDLQNESMDRLSAQNYNLNEHKINVVGMNLISDMASGKDTANIKFADNDLKEYIVSRIDEHTIEHSFQSTAYSPIYKYTVKYAVQDDGGYFGFTRGDMNPRNESDSYNPAVLTTSAAIQNNVMQVSNIVTTYAYHSVDTSSERMGRGRHLSSRYDNRYSLSAINTDLNSNNPLFLQPDQESVWFKPFVTFENVPLKNGPKVSSVNYGTLVGFDANPVYHKKGWEGVWSGYVGYTGSNAHYSGNDMVSNGGLMGATYSLFKGQFYTATTLTAGAMLDQVTTMYGKDNMTTLYAGIGNKTGYNFDFKEGLFILQPSLMLSYTFANTFDYTNAAGVRIDSDPIHAIQVSPGVKFYMNTKSGWQPYIGVNMIWNIMDQTHVKADGVKLPEMSVKPYVQYGIGVQKQVKDNFTAYGQAMLQNGGRNGISLTFGFRWALGKKSNDKSVNVPKETKKVKAKPVSVHGQRHVLKSL